MAETDSLEVKVQADADEAAKGLDVLAEKLSGISDKLSAITSQKLNINLSFGGESRQAVSLMERQVESASKKMAENLASAFSVDKSGLKSIQTLSRSIGQITLKYLEGNGSDGLEDAMGRLQEELTKSASSTRHADSEMQRFYATLVKTGKIKVDPMDMSDEDWSSLDGELRRHLNKKGLGSSLDSLMKEWREQFKGVFGGLEGEFNLDVVHDQVLALNQILKECREGIEVPIDKGMLSDSAWESIIDEARKLRDNLENSGTALQDAGRSQEDDFARIATGIKKIASVDADKLVNVGHAIKELSEGLRSLDGVTVNAAPLLSITEFAGMLQKKGAAADNLVKVGAAVSGLADAMAKLGGAQAGGASLAEMAKDIASLGKVNGGSQTAKELKETFSSMMPSMDGAEKLDALLGRFKDLGSDYVAPQGLDEARKKLGQVEAEIERVYDKLETGINTSTADSQLEKLAARFAQLTSKAEILREKIEEIKGSNASLFKDGSEPKIHLMSEESDGRGTLEHLEKYAPRLYSELAEEMENASQKVREATDAFTGAWDGVEIPEELKEPAGADAIAQALDKAAGKAAQFRDALENARPLKFSGNFFEMEKWISDLEASLDKLYAKYDRAEALGSALDSGKLMGYQYDMAQIINTLDIYEKKLDEARAAGELEIDIPHFDDAFLRTEGTISQLQASVEKTAGGLKLIAPNAEMTALEAEVRKEISGFNSLADSINKAAATKEHYGATDAYKGQMYSLEKAGEKIKELIAKENELSSAQAVIDITIPPVDAEIDKIASKVRGLGGSLSKMGLVVPTKGIEQLEREMEKVRKKYESLLDAMQQKAADSQFYASTPDFQRKMNELAALRQEYRELNSEQKNLALSGGGYKFNFGGIAQGIEKAQSAIGKLGNAMKGILGAFQRVGSAAANFAKNMLSAAVAATSFARKALGAINPLKAMSKHFEKTSRSAHKLDISGLPFLKTLKTLLKYSLGIRSLYILMNKLRSAVTEGMENLAQYSGKANASLSLLMNSLNQLKNASAAAASPLLNALAPALNQLIQLCIRGANAVNQLFSALTGNSTWIKAKTLADDYAGSLESASEAAKNLTTGIDELNILSETSGDSGASADDMFEEVPIDSKWVDIADWLKSMWEDGDFYELGQLLGQKLKDALDSIPWDEVKEAARKVAHSLATFLNGFIETEGLGYSIGRTLAEAFNTAFEFLDEFVHTFHFDSLANFIGDTLLGFMRNIDFEVIRSALTGLADGIVLFGNTLLEHDFWGYIGNTIANFVNIVVDAFNILAGFNFERLGERIAQVFRDTIGGIEWENLGNAIGNAFMFVWRTLEGFVNKMSELHPETLLTGWAELGQSLATTVHGAFEKIDFGRIGAVLVNGFNGISSTIQSFVDKMREEGTWQQIATNISDGLNNAINKIDLAAAGQALSDLVTSLLGTMLMAAENTNWGELGTKIGGFLTNIQWFEIFQQLFDLVTTVFGGTLGGFLAHILSKSEEIGQTLADCFNYAFERLRLFIESVSWDDMAISLYNGINTFIHGVDWAAAGQTLNEAVKKLLGVFKEVAENTDWEGFGRGIGQALSEIEWMDIIGGVFDILWDVFSGFISGLFDTSAGKVIVAFAAGLTAVKGVFSIIDIATDAAKWVNGVTTNLIPLGAKIISGVVPGVAAGVSKIGSALSGIVSAAQGALSGASILAQIGSVIFSPTGLLIMGVIAGVALIVTHWDKIKEAAKNVKEYVGNAWDNLREASKSKFDSIKEHIKGVWDKVSSTTESVWSKIGDFVKTKIPEITKNVETPFGELPVNLLEIGGNIIKGLKDGISGAAKGIKEWIKEHVTDPIKNGTKEDLGINSPSTVFASIGEDTMQGLMNGVDSKEAAVLRSMSSVVTDSLKQFSGLGKEFNAIGAETMTEMGGGVSANTGMVGDRMAAVASLMKSGFNGLADHFTRIGMDAMAGMVNGLNSSDIMSVASNLANMVSSTFKNILGIHSPSTVFEGIGEDTMEGFENGVSFKGKGVSAKMFGIAEELAESFSGIEFRPIIQTVWGVADVAAGKIAERMEALCYDIKSLFADMPEYFTWLSERVEDGILSGISGLMGNLEGIANSIEKLFVAVVESMSNVFDSISIDSSNFNLAGMSNYSLNIPAYASGGFPEDGLFFANSTELVGKFDNGKTAVANNEQITEGIRQAAYDGMMQAIMDSGQASYLADIARNTRETADKDTTVRIGDRDIVDSYRRGTARMGYDFS